MKTNSDKKTNEEVKNWCKCVIYTFIFSLIGLLVELIYCSTIGEKGFTLGLLCPIYGICASILIRFLKKYKNNKVKTFIYGMIVLTVMEYLISFTLEALFGIKFWDYSEMNFIQRINLIHIPLFGVASVIIMIIVPFIDGVLQRINKRAILVISIILLAIIIIEMLFTIWGITVYNIRVKEQLNGKNYISNNTWIEQFQNKVFSNKNMQKLFPKMKIVNNDGNTVLIKDIIN